MKKEHLKFIRISSSRLLKLEVKAYAEDVIRIVEIHDPEVLKIDKIFDLLKGKSEDIKLLVVPYRGHHLTKRLKRLRDKRSLYVSTIHFELKKVRRLDVTGDDNAVLKVENEITRFLDKLANSKNELVMHQRIVQFINEVKENGELSEAIESLGFLVHLDDLESTLTETLEVLNERESSTSERPNVNTSDLKKSVLTAIGNVFDEINLQQLKNPELDYGPLIGQLNEMLNNLAILINKRKLHNEKKAAQKLIDNGGGGEQPTIPDEGDEPEGPNNSGGDAGKFGFGDEGQKYQLNVEVTSKKGANDEL